MSDNNRLKRTLEFDLADAPMIAAAFRLAACTAMMCSHKDADKKLRAYEAVLKQFVPDAAKHFDEERWAEIGMALLTATSFRVTLEPRRWERDRGWWYEGNPVVYVGTKRFEADGIGARGVKRGDDETLKAIYEAIAELSPLGCEGAWDSAKERA